MNSYPTFILVEKLNNIECLQFQCEEAQYYDDTEQDLESRQPEPFIEYDSNGNEIVDEAIGYTENSQFIWLNMTRKKNSGLFV